jgi:hypothetical protein
MTVPAGLSNKASWHRLRQLIVFIGAYSFYFIELYYAN